jgi:hypothetical protein
MEDTSLRAAAHWDSGTDTIQIELDVTATLIAVLQNASAMSANTAQQAEAAPALPVIMK